MRWALLVLGLAGCAAQPPTLRFWHFGPASRGKPETTLLPAVADACDVLGVVCEATDEWSGAIYLDLVEPVSGQQGRTPKKPPLRCYPQTRTNLDPLVIAHEVLHAAGLSRHSQDPENVLYSCDAPGDRVTPDQHTFLERRARRLDRCP